MIIGNPCQNSSGILCEKASGYVKTTICSRVTIFELNIGIFRILQHFHEDQVSELFYNVKYIKFLYFIKKTNRLSYFL